MATKTTRSAETWKFILEADRALPPEEQTTWILRPLTNLERADARDNMARIHAQPDGSTATVTRTHRLSLDLCLSNIERVENFPAGAPEAWPAERAAQIAYLDGLEDEDVKAIGNEIWVHSSIGGTVKN